MKQLLALLLFVLHQGPMRHLLTSLALLATFAAAGQVDGFQLPYNPDVEPDGFIGINDVLAILPLYGQEYSSSDLAVNADSSSMLIYVGEMNYATCAHHCKHLLANNWRLAELEDLGVDYYWAQSYEPWVSRTDPMINSGFVSSNQAPFLRDDGDLGGLSSFNVVKGCICATHERRQIQYTACSDGGSYANYGMIEACISEKLQEGWYPLGPLQLGTSTVAQSFWRWAE
jgi:hypothetical protein